MSLRKGEDNIHAATEQVLTKSPLDSSAARLKAGNHLGAAGMEPAVIPLTANGNRNLFASHVRPIVDRWRGQFFIEEDHKLRQK
jgi:hypothetical protein